MGGAGIPDQSAARKTRHNTRREPNKGRRTEGGGGEGALTTRTSLRPEESEAGRKGKTTKKQEKKHRETKHQPRNPKSQSTKAEEEERAGQGRGK